VNCASSSINYGQAEGGYIRVAHAMGDFNDSL